MTHSKLSRCLLVLSLAVFPAAPGMAADVPAPSAPGGTPESGNGQLPREGNGASGRAAAVPQLPSPSLIGLLGSLTAYLSQDDIELLYIYLRDTAIASLLGRDTEDVYLPPDLAFKMEVLQQRAIKEGNHYLQTVVIPELTRLAPSLFEDEPASPPAGTAPAP